MSRFCFYLGDNREVATRIRSQAAWLWGNITEVVRDSFWLFMPDGDLAHNLAETEYELGAISGYVRCDRTGGAGEGTGSASNRLFINEILNRWPLSDDWTGSFGAVSYSKVQRTVVLCNDSIGYRPIYYSLNENGLVGGTSLLVLSRSIASPVDPIGVLERISIPYCNYGRRTLLKDISRLLPGERSSFSRGGTHSVSTFDNQLCKDLIEGDTDDVARTVWDCLQRETDLALDGEDQVAVALSGGWDSRLALASVSQRSSALSCYTFGNADLHEVKIARRCALAIGAKHQYFPIENAYFPTRFNFEHLIQQTEIANQLQWCTLTDSFAATSRPNEVLLLGDLCESISALNMKQFSTREARVTAFTKGLLGQKEQICPASDESFRAWKDRTKARVLDAILRNVSRLSPELAAEYDTQQLVDQVSGDLDLCFSRVADNAPRFEPMFTELFYWFHRARFLIAGQAILLGSRFRPVCPAISMRFMRLISSLHPRLRIRRRLMNGIAGLPEFDALARIPSAQIPWVSAKTPSMLRELVWGARSGADQVLIRRAMRNKNPRMRQRVLPTLDYMKEYQRENAVPNVRSWFSGKWLSGDRYVDVVRRRASLSAWPLSNLDIAAPANVSIFLDLCELEQHIPDRVPNDVLSHEVEFV